MRLFFRAKLLRTERKVAVCLWQEARNLIKNTTGGSRDHAYAGNDSALKSIEDAGIFVGVGNLLFRGFRGFAKWQVIDEIHIHHIGVVLDSIDVGRVD